MQNYSRHLARNHKSENSKDLRSYGQGKFSFNKRQVTSLPSPDVEGDGQKQDRAAGGQEPGDGDKEDGLMGEAETVDECEVDSDQMEVDISNIEEEEVIRGFGQDHDNMTSSIQILSSLSKDVKGPGPFGILQHKNTNKTKSQN